MVAPSPDFHFTIYSGRKQILALWLNPVKGFLLLIAMALDAAHGTAHGVKSLAQAAMQAGATREEIAETLRVVQYISGAGSTYTAAQGLRELF